MDINGGDSGFHDASPVNNGIHSTSLDVTQQNLVYEQYGEDEPDSSNLNMHDQSYNDIEEQPPDKDLDDNDGEDNDVASTISDLSGLSDLSNLSGQEWKPTAGPLSWVQKQMYSGINPRTILMELLPKGALIPPNLNSTILWKIIVGMLSEPPRRSKLSNINTMDDVARLLRTCRKIMVLTGAGVSVSCGIPDFRSKNGVYARLSKDYPDLPDPQAMFDIHYFRKDPRPFFKFAKEIYPGQFSPSPSHRFIRLIEKQGKLLRNYTQNIDTLEHAAGIEKVITCHGSFATATCTLCQYKVESSFIKDEIFSQRIPYCPLCPADIEERGIMKPDIVFFGEGLSDEFHETMGRDKDDCDLLIVMGSSLKVRPVALIPNSLPPNVPQILINREPLRHLNFDVELLGDCDVIIGELSKRLEEDWKIDNTHERLREITTLPSSNKKFHPTNCRLSSSASAHGSLEVNNNFDVLGADTTCKPSKSKAWTSTPVPPGEESNSCDCRGMSAIRLEDSQDSLSLELPSSVPDLTHTECDQHSSNDKYDPNDIWPLRSVSTSLPDDTFLFVSPSRYIFEGAEVYNEGKIEPTSCVQDDNSPYDSGSPSLTSDEDEEEHNVPESAYNEEDASRSHLDFEDVLDKYSLEPRTSVDSESRSSAGSELTKGDGSS